MLKEVNCDFCCQNSVKVVFPQTIDAGVSEKFGYACSNNRHGEHYRVVRCKNCGLLYCSPRFSQLNIEFGYQKVQDVLYQKEAQGRRKTFQRNLKNLLKFVPKGELLDVGCSLGIFLDEARKAGWDGQGIEPSEWCVQQGKKTLGLNISQGTYRDIPRLSQQFDVITMWDVLEHLDSPMDALRISHSALREGGILAFSTVDIGSLYARLLGRKWPWLMTMHIYYFDRKRIRQYLRKAGFKLLSVRVYKHIVSAEYLLYKLKKINRFLFFLMNIIYRIIRLFKKEVFLTIALGDFMEVYAQKILQEKERDAK